MRRMVAVAFLSSGCSSAEHCPEGTTPPWGEPEALCSYLAELSSDACGGEDDDCVVVTCDRNACDGAILVSPEVLRQAADACATHRMYWYVENCGTDSAGEVLVRPACDPLNCI